MKGLCKMNKQKKMLIFWVLIFIITISISNVFDLPEWSVNVIIPVFLLSLLMIYYGIKFLIKSKRLRNSQEGNQNE